MKSKLSFVVVVCSILKIYERYWARFITKSEADKKERTLVPADGMQVFIFGAEPGLIFLAAN